MVKKEKIGDKTYYQCETCKFYYADKEWADKCQTWCETHRSCNINITKNVVDPVR